MNPIAVHCANISQEFTRKRKRTVSFEMTVILITVAIASGIVFGWLMAGRSL